MSDNGSQISKSSNRHRAKVCAFCGKVESALYARHAENHHGKGTQQEWVPDEPLIEEPWCDNWKEFITNSKAMAINILPRY